MTAPGSWNHPEGSHLLPRSTPFGTVTWVGNRLMFWNLLVSAVLHTVHFLTSASAASGLEAGLGWADSEPEADFC